MPAIDFSDTKLRVVVVGAGAVGGFVGAMLARAGHDVTLVARGDHGKAIETNGLTVETPTETLVVRTAVVSRVEDAAGANADVVIVAVKTNDLSQVGPRVDAMLGEGGVAIPLLNGLDSEAELATELGKDRVVGAIAQLSARLLAPGTIRVDGPARMTLAPLSPEAFPRIERLSRALSCSDLVCDARSDLARLLWNKLLWNAPFNAVCALTRRSAGDALAVPELEALLRAAMREVVLVARAEGVTIDDRAIEKNIEVTRTHHGSTVPSMLQDVLRGRPTETRALQGSVIARARRHGIATPVLDTLHALMLGIEAKTM